MKFVDLYLFTYFSDDQINQCFSVRVGEPPNDEPRSSRFEGVPQYSVLKPEMDKVSQHNIVKLALTSHCFEHPHTLSWSVYYLSI